MDFISILKISCTAGIMAAAVILVRPLLNKNFSALSRKTLWMIVLLLFIMPFRIESDLSLYNLINLDVGVTPVEINNSTTGVQNISVSGDTPIVNYGVYDTFHNIPTETYLLIFWCIGVILTAVFFIASHIKLRKMLKSVALIPITYLLETMKISDCKAKLYTSEKISAPITYGFFRSKIILPSNYKSYCKNELNYVLKHETEHMRHNDLMLNYVWLIVLCMHWFNPLAWISWHLYRKDIELYCDECVVKNIGIEHRKEYAQTILNLSAVKKNYCSVNSFGSSSTEQRIRKVLSCKKYSKLSVFLTIVIAMSFTFSLATDAVTREIPTDFIARNLAVAENNIDFTYVEMQTSGLSLISSEYHCKYANEKKFTSLSELNKFLTEKYELNGDLLASADLTESMIYYFGKNKVVGQDAFSVTGNMYMLKNDNKVMCFCIFDNKSYVGIGPNPDMMTILKSGLWVDNFHKERLIFLENEPKSILSSKNNYVQKEYNPELLKGAVI